jgi:L-2-hydroxyglutarate oxidase LhgO
MIHRSTNGNNQQREPLLSSSSSYIPPPIYYATGTYFRYQHNTLPFHHLIYPLPEEDGGGLGIHATLDLTGTQVKFGPDVQWIAPYEHPSPDTISLNPDPNKADKFYNSIRTYWPDLPDESLQPDYVGIRPKLYHPTLLVEKDTTNSNNKANSPPFQDFRIDTSEQHRIPGLIHLYGIESPGLTSSMAIADYIVHLLQQEEQ